MHTTPHTSQSTNRNLRRILTIIGLVVALGASACGSDKQASEEGESLADESTTTVETSSGESAGDDSGTTGDDAGDDGTADDDVVATPVSCPPEGDPAWSTAARSAGNWPMGTGTGPSVLDGAAVGAHPGYDRFVLTFTPETADLSYSVSVVSGQPEGPQAGVEVDVDGSAFLAVQVVGIASWMRDPADPYVGPTEISGPGVGAANLVEAVLSEEFEGYMTWHLGYNALHDFNVFVLDSPTRLVVDMCTDGDAVASGSTQAAAAGCSSSAGPVPAEAVYGPARQANLDGLPGEELVYTYFVPSSDTWVLRVDAVDGSFHSEWPIPDSGGAFASEVQNLVDVNSDGYPEVMVSYSGGAYTREIGFVVVRDCELEPTRNIEAGIFSWPIGASVANIGHFTCLGDSVRFETGSIDASLAEPIWAMQTTRNVLVGTVWEPMGVAGSNYAYVSDDSVPPVSGSADCPSLPSTSVELG